MGDIHVSSITDNLKSRIKIVIIVMPNVYRPMAKAAANYETSLLGEHRN